MLAARDNLDNNNCHNRDNTGKKIRKRVILVKTIYSFIGDCLFFLYIIRITLRSYIRNDINTKTIRFFIYCTMIVGRLKGDNCTKKTVKRIFFGIFKSIEVHNIHPCHGVYLFILFFIREDRKTIYT